MDDPVPNPKFLNETISTATMRLTMRMLAKNPQQRYQNPTELIQAIHRILPLRSQIDNQETICSLLKRSSSGDRSSSSNMPSTPYWKIRSTISTFIARKKKSFPMLWLTIIILLSSILVARWLFVDKSSSSKPPVSQASASKAVPGPASNPAAAAPKFHSLRITTTPKSSFTLSGMDAKVIKKLVAKDGKIELRELSPDKYKLHLSRPGFEELHEEITLNRNLQESFPLKRQFSNLIVQTTPGATIKLYPKSKAPEFEDLDKTFLERRGGTDSSGYCQLRNVHAGPYKVEVSLRDYKTQSKNLYLKDNSRLNFKLEEIVKRSPRSPEKITPLKDGTVLLYTVGDPRLIKYISRVGGEYRIGKEKWQKAKRFPWRLSLAPGKYKISIKIKGTNPVSEKEIQLDSAKNISCHFNVRAIPATLKVVSDSPRSRFFYGKRWYDCPGKIEVPPFQALELKVSTSYMPAANIKIAALKPGQTFVKKLELSKRPGSKEYQDAMKLFSSKKYKESLPLFEEAA